MDGIEWVVRDRLVLVSRDEFGRSSLVSRDTSGQIPSRWRKRQRRGSICRIERAPELNDWMTANDRLGGHFTKCT